MCFSLSPFSVCASNKKHQIYFATGFSVNCLIGCEIALDIELYDYRHTVCICVCVCARTHTFRRQTSQRFIPICTLASISEFHSINAISFPLHKIHVNFVCFCDIFFRLLLGGSPRLTLIICRILPLNLRHEPCIHALLIDKYDAIYRSHSHPSAKFVFSSSLFAHSQIVSISLCIHLSNIWWFLFLFSQPRSKK